MTFEDLPAFANNLPDIFDTTKACIAKPYNVIPSPTKPTKAQTFFHKLLEHEHVISPEQLWKCSQGAVRNTAVALELLLKSDLGIAARDAAHHVLGRILFDERACIHYEKIIISYLEPSLNTIQIISCRSLVLSRILSECSIIKDSTVIIEELLQLLKNGHYTPVLLAYLNIFARKLERVDILKALMLHYESIDRINAFRTARDALEMTPQDMKQKWICVVMALEFGDRVCLASNCSHLDRNIEGRLFHEMAFCVIDHRPFDEPVMQLWRNLLMRLDPKSLKKSITSRLRMASEGNLGHYDLPNEVDSSIVLLCDEKWLDRVERIIFLSVK